MKNTFFVKLLQSLAIGWVSSNALAATIFTDDFGNSSTRTSSPYVPTTNTSNPTGTYFKYAGNVNIGVEKSITDGYYAVIPTLNLATITATGYWGSNKDHTTPAGTGAALVINAGNVKNEFYRRIFQASPGASYKITAYRLTRNSLPSTPSANISNIIFEAQDAGTQTKILSQSPAKMNTGVDAWEEMNWTFTLPTTCGAAGSSLPLAISLKNNLEQIAGNDFFIDDIRLEDSATAGSILACPTTTNATIQKTTTQDDSSQVTQNQAKTVAITGNDSVSNGGTLDYTSLKFTQPSHGTVTISPVDGSIIYTPAQDYVGSDSFTYTICNKASLPTQTPNCSQSTVTLTVTATAPTPAPTGLTPPSPQAIPTLNELGLFALSFLMLAAMAFKNRRRFL